MKTKPFAPSLSGKRIVSILGRAAKFALCGSLLSAAAVAQTRFCIGGDLDHLTAFQKTACLAKLNQVRVASAKFQTPEDWHFVVVCNEPGWKEYAAFSKRTSAELEDASADTNLDQRTTFFRGERLAGAEEGGRMQRIIAYEIAGIVLKSTEKEAIQNLVARWIPEPEKSAPVLQASR
jgi:nitroreductase